MIFCLVTLHLWGHIFGKFPQIKGLAYADDDNIIKTKVLTERASVDHLFEHAKHFLDTDPDLEDIGHHFTREPLLFNENDTQ